MSEDLIRGWCPTPLRPMESGDGLLARLHPPIDGYTGVDLMLIAALAGLYGNGAIEITQRRNLQLRGLSADTFDAFVAKAVATGLIDRAERLSVLIAPGPKFDLAARDNRPIKEALHAVLEKHKPSAFPAKFVIVVGTGGDAGLDSVEADIRIDPVKDRWRIALCGTLDGALPVFKGRDVEAVAAVEALLQNYPVSEKRGKGRDFALGWAKAAGIADLPPIKPLSSSSWANFSNAIYPAYGRLDAKDLHLIGETCEDLDVSALPGPGRCLLLSTFDVVEQVAIEASVDEDRMVLTDDDPRHFVDVCTGAPGCANTTVSTLGGAQILADLMAHALGPDRRLHISGCAKGCAHPGRSAIVLAAKDGEYALGFDATAAEAIENPSVEADGDSVSIAEIGKRKIGKRTP
jgi:precorrin-3B synthase